MARHLIVFWKVLLWLYVVVICALLLAPRASSLPAAQPLSLVVRHLRPISATPAGFVTLIALPLLLLTWWELVDWQQMVVRR